MVTSTLEDKSDIGFIESTFPSEISLADSLPDLFAFARTANKWSRLTDQLLDFVAGYVCQTAESLVHNATWNLMK